MRTQDEFTLQIISELDNAGIRYMIAGSFLSNLYGQPRSTHDTDIVVECDASSIGQFASQLKNEFYYSEQAIREALSHSSLFNVIDTVSGWRADIIIRKQRPFSIEEFSRRTSIEFCGRDVWVGSAEDAILSKLEWAKKSDSERQIQDAASIVAVRHNNLDYQYLRRWAVDLQVVSTLEQIISQSESLGATEVE